MIDFDIIRFVLRKIPWEWRFPNREKLFKWPFFSLNTVWIDFKDWRNSSLWRANITGQLMSLETNLNRNVDGAFGQIKIIEGLPLSAWISLESEQADVLEVGLLDKEPDDFREIGLEQEEGASLEVDFRVAAPLGADERQIRNIVETFRLAGMTYDIVLIDPEAGLVTHTGEYIIDHNNYRIGYG
ncbi:hypothetical protein [Persicobacter sp. CCB-QB2]|uniref:hypothetical protein n=1 Tax=Persicobacter sp. CCB-QB2 TaxID=1561025 RepID=UPI0006A98A0C|nr:hypothetical protein [Persicobacter sp. CCB-QB2]